MSNSNCFLKKITNLFFLHGAKSLTMDDIASEFGMSKKTLYEQYNNKEQLLFSSLDFFLEELYHKIAEIEGENDNPIKAMLERNEKLSELSLINKSIFMRQLIKYYPSVYENHLIKIHERISKIFIHNILIGRKMKIYREDFDEKLYSKLMLHTQISTESSPLFEIEILPENKLQFKKDIMLKFLYSLVTEKGAAILKNEI